MKKIPYYITDKLIVGFTINTIKGIIEKPILQNENFF